MSSDVPLDRALGVLARAISESNDLPADIFELIEEKLAASGVNEAKVDILRKLIVSKKGKVTAAEVEVIFSPPQPVAGTSVLSNIATFKLENSTAVAAGSASGSFVPGGYGPGGGIDTITGASRGQCILPADLTESDPTADPPRDLKYSLERINSYESLMESLSAGVSASVSYGLGNGGGSVSFTRDFKSSENSVYLVARVSVIFEESIRAWSDLKPEWAAILREGENGRKRFFQGCGNAYARGVKKGSEFAAVYQLAARDSSEKERIQASFSGGYSGVFSASADFARAINKVSQFSNVTIKIISTGYPGGSIGTTADDITKYVNEFNDHVTYKDARSLMATYGEYSDFPSYITTGPFIDGLQNAYIKSAEKDFQFLLARLALYSSVKDAPDSYALEERSLKDVAATERLVNEKLFEVGQAAAQCYEDAKHCKEYRNIDREKFWAPTAKAIDYFVGGCSGQSRRFGDFNGGCLDSNSGTTWGSIPALYFDFESAKAHCAALTENKTRGWILPSVNDATQLAGPEGAIAGFKEGGFVDDWFWVHDGTAERKPVRINLLTGITKTAENSVMKYKTICRQGGA